MKKKDRNPLEALRSTEGYNEYREMMRKKF
jgi:hypothetical protein